MTSKKMENRYKFLPDNHIHTLDGRELCGTSTVLGVLHKELTWWASGLAVSKLGWTPINDPKTKKKADKEERLTAARTKLAEIKDMTDIEYLALLDTGYKAHKEKLDTSAEAGTDMHARLEDYVKMCMREASGVPTFPKFGLETHFAVNIFADWAMENVQYFVASEVHCYSERMWTGGIVDLAFVDNDNNAALLDFKSAKDVYPTHFMQNAGYDLAICENDMLDANGNVVQAAPPNGFEHYYVFPFGMEEPRAFRMDEGQFEGRKTKDFCDAFEACVTLYKLLNKKK